VIIEARFNGPPATGNGGYSAGLFASQVTSDVDGVLEITLRRPPPLDTELTVRPGDSAGLVAGLFAGDVLIAEARPGEVTGEDVVPAVPLAEAERVAAEYPGFREHPFPTCFVCGPEREVGDGLRVFPGRLPGGGVAAPFIAPRDLSPAVIWAALDCPSGWAVPLEARPYVLGRMAARVDAVPDPGDECVVTGEMLGEEGRKAYSRSTLYSPRGDVLAVARTTWVALT
jgi:hypothetical protein